MKSIIDVCTDHGVELKSVGGGKLQGLCPLHREKTPSFTIYSDSDSFFCLAKETRVITDKGVFCISDIVGKEVEIINGNGTWEKVVFRSFGKQRLIKITLESMKKQKIIYATPEHRWFVYNTGEAKSENIKEIVTQQLSSKMRLSQQWLSSVTVNHLDKEGVRHGFIYGDGCLKRTSKNGNFEHDVPFYNGKDFHVSRYFDNVYKPKGKSAYHYKGRTHYTCKYNAKQIPCLENTKEYLMGFLAGYFVADGYCHVRDSCIQFNSARKQELEKIKHLCTIVGIATYPIRNETRQIGANMGVIGIAKKEYPMYKISLVRSTIPECFWITDKKPQNKIMYKSYLGHKVKSVEETNRYEEVFCCQTSTGSFVLEDFILTGNCWGCKASGDAIELLMQLDGVSFLEAKQILYGDNLEDYIKERVQPREKQINYKLLLNKGISPVAREIIEKKVDVDKVLNLLYNLDNEIVLTQEQFEQKYKEYINNLRGI